MSEIYDNILDVKIAFALRMHSKIMPIVFHQLMTIRILIHLIVYFFKMTRLFGITAFLFIKAVCKILFDLKY